MLAVSITELSKSYKNTSVLNIPSLQIGEGEIFGLVGNNGAGKTTLFRLMLDLIAPTEGTVSLNGAVANESTHWKNFTGAYLDHGFLLDFLKPEEYFYFIGDQYGMSKHQVNQVLETMTAFFNGEILGQKKFIRDLSAGNKQKVGIGGVFIIQPQIIILDEPFNALDPTSQTMLKNLIIDYHRKHAAITLVSSHDLNHITEVCTRIALLEKGSLIKDMAVSENTLSELNQYFNQGWRGEKEANY